MVIVLVIAMLIAFVGGLIGQALVYRTIYRRALAFIVPVFISTGLLCLGIVIEVLHGAPLSWKSILLDWQTIGMWALVQCSTVLVSAGVTGFGWFCSWCVRSVFE